MAGAYACYFLANQTFGEGRPDITTMLFVVYIFLLWAIAKALSYAANTDSFFRGGSGENKIKEILDTFSDQYSFFRGVQIQNTPYDIDFVLVGPTGIYTIETKSHAGEIEYKNRELLRNGKQFEKNIYKQSLDQALYLHNKLQEQFKIDVFVQPVIAFSSWRAKMRFGLNKVGLVFIVQGKWLNKLISSQQSFRYPIDRRLIENYLKGECADETAST